MTVIVNNKVHIRENYKEPTGGKFGDCTSKILKNFAAEDISDSKGNAKPEAETCCLNNCNKTTI